MIGRLWYPLYGACVLSLLGWAEYRGWTWSDATRVTNVPRSIRDNPGAYRSIYQASPHSPGGK